MTTYSFVLELRDREMGAVETALKRYRDYCLEHLDEQPTDPGAVLKQNRYHLRQIDEILSRLRSQPTMTSTSSHLWPDGKIPTCEKCGQMLP